MQDEPELDRAAVGEHAPVQGRADPPRLRHRPLGDADHAGHDGRLRDRRSASATGSSRRASSPSRSSSRRWPSTRPGCGRSSPRAHATSSSTARSAPSTAVGRELGLIARVSARRRRRSARELTDRQARDLPLDAHLHTDLSPDSDVPIDVYAALAVERGIAELAITDHVDFDAAATRPSTTRRFDDRERVVREAAERWAPRGRRDPLRGRAHLRPALGGRHPRPPGPPSPTTSHRLGPRLARLAVPPGRVAALGRRPVAGRDRRARTSTRSRPPPAPGCSTRSATSTS